MPKVWRVVIMDSQPTRMLGTKLILEEQAHLRVQGMVSSCAEGMQLIKELKPELILLDDDLPEGRSELLLGQIRYQSPESEVIVYTDEEGLTVVHTMFSLGASGVLSKQATSSQLILLIEGLRAGFTLLPLEWLRHGIWPIVGPMSKQELFELTEMEIFIMERIVQGITYDKIALEIEVSRRSIDNYLRKIYVKLNVSTRAQAIEKFTLHSQMHSQIYA
ncbi:response regulator transcription factor [Paenibacillus sp. IHBB 10380]|uniref:response regulator transcription factor n=1 Tax=Paenibacillus sp. IHBB 10380 TaxID=1566358 RepID=UPI0005CFCCA6|nr:response regulator transcription factor [Paenibacillus sp. IHBB 10380]AJS59642.1 chemotaxis protein CheY [Paenibacillus sp. IHBB 10380]